MKSMLYMSLFWKIHNDYREAVKISKKNLIEKKCKSQFKEYLEYLKTKDMDIQDYVSIENMLFN